MGSLGEETSSNGRAIMSLLLSDKAIWAGAMEADDMSTLATRFLAGALSLGCARRPRT